MNLGFQNSLSQLSLSSYTLFFLPNLSQTDSLISPSLLSTSLNVHPSNANHFLLRASPPCRSRINRPAKAQVSSHPRHLFIFHHDLIHFSPSTHTPQHHCQITTRVTSGTPFLENSDSARTMTMVVVVVVLLLAVADTVLSQVHIILTD